MNKKVAIKTITILCFIIAIAVLIKCNVQATKEPTDKEDTGTINLEVTSSTVQELYSQLSLLNDGGIIDYNYKNLYFDFQGEEKYITGNDQLFIALDNLYRNNELSNVEDTDINTIDVEGVKNKIGVLFNDSSFETNNAVIYSSMDCGIKNYLYTGTSYEFEVDNCNPLKKVTKVKLDSATKKSDYIYLKVRALFLETEDLDDIEYHIYNFSNKEELSDTTYTSLEEVDDSIFDNEDIDVYEFAFLLKGDDYYLTKITRL